MKSKAKSRIIILVTLGVLCSYSISFVSITNLNEQNYENSLNFNINSHFRNDNPKTSAISDKIYIDDDDPSSDWTVANATGICTGEGTILDPYIIEDLVIDGGGSGSCIYIKNSAVFFKIENCTVFNSGSYFSQFSQIYDAGISLLNVENAILFNNTASGNYPGIVVCSCEENTISGNIVNNNFRHGIAVYSSRYNTISGNIGNNNSVGIYLDNSYYNNVSRNIDNYNTISGIYLTESSYNDIVENNLTYNYYGINLFRDYGSNTFSGNTVSNSISHGIYIRTSNNNIFSENNVNNNAFHGIYLYNSYSNTISKNDLNYNGDSGICLSTSDLNIVSENTAFHNSYAIVMLNSDSNTITGNIFIGNDVCIYEDEDSTSNFFENNDCGNDEVDGISMDLIFIILTISIGAVIIVATTLLSRIKRKRK